MWKIKVYNNNRDAGGEKKESSHNTYFVTNVGIFVNEILCYGGMILIKFI